MSELVSDQGKWAQKIEQKEFEGGVQEVLIERILDSFEVHMIQNKV
ncbi:MAG: hypothetical protein M1327_06575 [Candidatus Thermoplasmatota archaeon]|nr:hypothetical protein [Candidatus Thermoplasmatota archaeon]